MSASITIVCVHGVGLWPPLFDALSLPSPVELVVRPGYDDVPAVASFEAQVGFVADTVRRLAPAVVVGVSGGATLALACAARPIDGLVAAVSHEPLIGSLAPSLNDRVGRAGATLQASPGEAPALDFLRGLYGDRTWDALPETGHRWACDHTATICAEVAHFASYQPSADDLGALAVPHLTTVGSESAPVRHEIADLLGTLGSTTAVVDGSGHLALVDQPERFGSIIHDFVEHVTA